MEQEMQAVTSPHKKQTEKNTNRRASMLKSGVVFVILIGITFYVLFHNQDKAAVCKSLALADKRYLFIGLLCMCTFTVCEGLNIRRGLRIFGYHTGIFQGIKYAVVGFFFSSITPSATGGQPLQVYYMHKDKYNLSHASLALLLELASYQVITILYAVVGFLVKWDFLTKTIGSVKYLLLIGIVLNAILLALVGIAIFSKTVIHKLVAAVMHVLRWLHLKNIKEWETKAKEMVEEYQSSAVYFKSHKTVMLKMFFTSFIQITALHSIPFWIYCAFGLHGYSFFDIVMLQAILFIAVSVLPLPGTVGVSESGFLLLYKTLFPKTLLSSAMLLSRGISFYVFVALTGMILAILYLQNKWYHFQKYDKMEGAYKRRP